MIPRALHAAERFFDAFFGAAANPLRQLGALAYAFFWAAVASGIYVYVLYDTSVEGAYASVERLSAAPYAFNAIMRSVHRYASDGFALVIALHLVRELAYGRYHGFRWFSWTSGVPLILLALASGVIGYWLVWDAFAQFIAVAAAEWLGALPGFGATLVRNFIAPEAVSDRFFSLLAFAHIGVALLLLLGMWVHVQRITRARVWPHTGLACGTAAMLLALSLVIPALSQPEANLDRIVSLPSIDWFYAFPFPLVYSLSAQSLWLCSAAVLIVLGALPWLVRSERPTAAVVNDAHCNGCGRCAADCPYSAVVLAPAAQNHAARARVLPDLCASCGICVGACPSATPFRSVTDFVSGIELPHLPVAALRSRLDKALSSAAGAAPNIIFACDRRARGAHDVRATTVETLTLPCIGMLPPSFVDYALRHGAADVKIAACDCGDCEFRLGAEWTHARLSGEREPRLRARRRDRIDFTHRPVPREAALA